MSLKIEFKIYKIQLSNTNTMLKFNIKRLSPVEIILIITAACRRMP